MGDSDDDWGSWGAHGRKRLRTVSPDATAAPVTPPWRGPIPAAPPAARAARPERMPETPESLQELAFFIQLAEMAEDVFSDQCIAWLLYKSDPSDHRAPLDPRLPRISQQNNATAEVKCVR